MANRRLLWSKPAEEDLFVIWHYLARQGSIAIADAQLRNIAETTVRLVMWPESGRHRDDIHPGLQSVVSIPYVVFYRVESTSIQIVRVLHSRRDTDTIFSNASKH